MPNRRPLVTRFRQRSGKDGPVSGALQLIHLPVAITAGDGTFIHRVNVPDGATFEVTDVEFSAAGITATPEITMGDSASGTQIVASVTATTNLGALTVKDGAIAEDGFIDVTVSATASDAVTQGNLTICGYFSAPPLSVNA